MLFLPTPVQRGVPPTTHPPGSPAKLEVLRQRFEAGHALHVEGDPRIIHECSPSDPDWRLRCGRALSQAVRSDLSDPR